MNLAESFGGFLCSMVVVVWLFTYMAIRLIRTIDDDGEVSKTANNGLAAWIEKMCKK